MPRLHLVVGPNGAGKSTFVEHYLSPIHPGLPFVNADLIAKVRWPDSAEEKSYEAAKIAAAARTALIAQGRSFLAETVFSHPSKVDLIREARDRGYDVHLHIVMVGVNTAVERVRVRVINGGHSVPEAKIRERYERLWPLVVAAIPLTSTATCYDNSDAHGPSITARFTDGLPSGVARWPHWAPGDLTGYWSRLST